MAKRNLNTRTIKKKIDESWRHKLFKYEQDHYWKKRRDKADDLAQKYPKLVAFKNASLVKCYTCDKMMEWKDCNWSHWIEKGKWGNYWARREEWNIYPCCIGCNKHNQQTHIRRLTIYVTSVYWKDRVMGKRREENKVHPKPKRYEIDEVIARYEEKIKKL